MVGEAVVKSKAFLSPKIGVLLKRYIGFILNSLAISQSSYGGEEKDQKL